jgi:DNA-binding XRE family transcriptional regulator
LSLLEWTQEEMAKAIGKTQQRIGQILQEMADLPKFVKSFMESGES